MASSIRPSRVVFQLPDTHTWFENIAVTSTGSILATRVDVPEIWVIDPTTGEGKSLVKFPAPLTSVTGIAELKHDFYAVGVGQYDFAKGAIPGTWEVWTINLSAPDAAPTRIAAMPPVGLLNGMAPWDEARVLLVDSTYGKIYSVDVNKRTFTLIVDDELLTPGADPIMPIGVNGVKVRDGYIYFTNTARTCLGRVPVDSDAKPTGEVQVLAKGFATDDFCFAPDGASVYVVTHPWNTVVRIEVKEGAEAVTVAGDKETLEIAGGTACSFGRGEKDKGTLYVVTSGALVVPVKGQIEPAKVVAVDIS